MNKTRRIAKHKLHEQKYSKKRAARFCAKRKKAVEGMPQLLQDIREALREADENDIAAN